jgi:hypothetical protein
LEAQPADPGDVLASGIVGRGGKAKLMEEDGEWSVPDVLPILPPAILEGVGVAVPSDAARVLVKS